MVAIATLINGTAYDFSSIECSLLAIPEVQITELTYEDNLEPGELRGTRPEVLARTRGEYSASGSITMYKPRFKDFINRLILTNPLKGYKEISFPISVAYTELDGEGIVTDTLKGCRITNTSDSHSQGTDPLMVTADLHIMMIIRNGVRPVADNLGA